MKILNLMPIIKKNRNFFNFKPEFSNLVVNKRYESYEKKYKISTQYL